MNKKYLKVEGVVEITGLAKDTVYQYTSRNLIPYYKLGKLIRVEESEIQEWMESNLLILCI